MSYLATIAKLENTRRFEGADYLQVSQCLGDNVVVGLDAKDGDLVVHFSDDGQLSPEYCFENNLYSKGEMNKNPEAKGYFDHKRRVRAQVFRKQKSEAYVAPLETVAFTGVDLSTLTVGTRFDSLNEIHICNKYVTPATLKAANNNQPKQKTGLVAYLKSKFPEHMDTDQLKYAQDVDLVGLVTLTHKLHGTSQRSCLLEAPIPQKQNIIFSTWNKLVNKIPCDLSKIIIRPEVKNEWKSVYGTRRVVKGEVTEVNDYRTKCHKLLEPFIQKGECWYYEIVGFESFNSPIMSRVTSKDFPKDLKKQFGETITYKYGCMDGTCEIYVYRITVQNPDGDIYELPWSVVKNRCVKAGIKHVPQIDQFLVTHDKSGFVRNEIVKFVEENNIDLLDPSHPFEGICVRVDNVVTGKMNLWKEKNFWFKVGEQVVKVDDNVVDEEESQG